MIISYSKHGRSGTSKYPLENETAKVLLGDRDITERLIQNSKNKLKYRSGIISFEEQSPSKEVVQDVIDNFIKSTFAGLDQEQYNVLMVEHTNTDNYHIHFYIPRVELTSGKSFNPHWHKEDQTRLLKLQDYLNAKHKLSNPYERDKRRTLQGIDTKAYNRNELKEEINKHIEELVIGQKLQNRDEVVEYFKSSGIDVVRQSKHFITLDIDNERIRLKGTYYAETFKDYGAVEAELTRAERAHSPVTSRQLVQLEQELDKLVQHKAEANRRRYPIIEQDHNRERGLRTRTAQEKQVVQVRRHSPSEFDHRSGEHDVSQSIEQVASPSRIQIHTGRSELSQIQRSGRRPISEEKRHIQVHNNQRGIENDSTGARVINRVRRAREAQQVSVSSLGAERKTVYRRINQSYDSIREHNPQIERELRENTARGTGQEQGTTRKIHEQRESKHPSLAERFRQAYEHAKEFVIVKAQELANRLEEMRAKEQREKQLERIAQEARVQSSRSRGRSFSR